MAIYLRADHPVWRKSGVDWRRVGVSPDAEVEIHLGINPAFAPQLEGTGQVPCWCVARAANGKHPGMANSPGFVLRLDFDALVEAGVSEDTIFLEAFACGVGEYEDPEDGRPICEDCLRAAGNSPERRAQGGRRVCWSCVDMARDGWHSSAE